jgi:NAD(P)-dependent dehydrogenase (short-subunit alcohol dehydrogenase family)
MQHFVPRHAGKLINISGMGEKQRFPMHNPYTTSKSWLYTFTMNLAEEYKESGVGVFLFNPGLVETEMYRYLTFVRGYESGIKTFNVVARLFAGPPEPAVEKAVWLASSATDGRTGLRINRIGMGAMLAAVLREAGRMLSGKPAAKLEVNIQTIEPALDVTLPFENALPVDAVTA